MKAFLEIFLLVIVAIVLGVLFIYFTDTLWAPSTIQSPENKVCFSSRCFFVQLAKTNAEREKGLMNVTKLDKDSGMLFIFDKAGVYPFWMKNTLIPLDMIWINEKNEVVFIGQNVQPCKNFICPVVNPKVSAKYVLEINAGISNEMGLKFGDKIELKIK